MKTFWIIVAILFALWLLLNRATSQLPVQVGTDGSLPSKTPDGGTITWNSTIPVNGVYYGKITWPDVGVGVPLSFGWSPGNPFPTKQQLASAFGPYYA